MNSIDSKTIKETSNLAARFNISNQKKEIWTFGGGKGGVGKSVICCNIALYLVQRGYKVLLVDADFGAANIHTYLGMRSLQHSLSEFLLSSMTDLNNVIEPSPFPNLSLIAGSEDPLKISNPRFFHVNKLVEHLSLLDYDHILVDLGAGTTSQVIDLFTGGRKLIAICLPEPASIENTYRFLKYSYFRGFKKLIKNRDVQLYFERLLSSKQTENVFQLSELIKEIEKIHYKTAQELINYNSNFKPKLVMNRVTDSNDIRLGFAISNSCRKYLGFELDYVGFIEEDENLSKAVKRRSPILVSEPFCAASRCFVKISDQLLNSNRAL